MKFKSLLTCLAIALVTPMFAQESETPTEPVVCDVPGTLYYENAVETNDFLGSMCKIGSTLTYKLNVAETGKYLLYLNIGNKTSGANGFRYQILLDGTEVISVDEEKYYGGNWNVFIMRPHELNLTKGEVELKIVSASDRWNINSRVAPVILPFDNATLIGNEYPVAIDVMHPDTTSTLNYNIYANYGVDNHCFGSDNSVLVTSQDCSNKGASKFQSPYPKTKLHYLVKVEKEGVYPVELSGFFVPARKKDDITDIWALERSEIAGFTVNLKATWVNGEEFSTAQVELPTVSLDGMNIDTGSGKGSEKTEAVTATGSMQLKKGEYWIEVSTDYAYNDNLSLTGLQFGEPTEVTEGETLPYGKYVPVVRIDEITEPVYLGYPFTLTGTIALDQDDDVLTSAVIYLENEEIGNVTMGEGATFTYDVAAPTKLGEHNFKVIATTERGYKAENQIVVNVEKKKYTIKAMAGEGGNITFPDDSNVVYEGENITATITPNEGFYVEKVYVDGEAVDFTADETTGVVLYTFENVLQEHMLEVEFGQYTFTINGSYNAELGTITNCDNYTVAYGDNVACIITPATGYAIASITVDGEKVEVTNPDGQTYTFENVKENHTIAAEFEVKVYTITTEVKGEGGTIKATATEVKHGGEVEVTVTPNTDYKVKNVTVNGESVEIANPDGFTFKIENIAANCKVVAEFNFDDAIEGVNASQNVSYTVTNGTINLNVQSVSQVALYDITGKVAYNNDAVCGDVQIMGSHGVYILRVSNGVEVFCTKVVL